MTTQKQRLPLDKRNRGVTNTDWVAYVICKVDIGHFPYFPFVRMCQHTDLFPVQSVELVRRCMVALRDNLIFLAFPLDTERSHLLNLRRKDFSSAAPEHIEVMPLFENIWCGRETDKAFFAPGCYFQHRCEE